MTYRPSPLFRILPIVGTLAFLALAVLGFFVGFAEKDPFGWWFCGGAMLPVGYFLFNTWQVSYTITLHPNHLTLRRLGQETEIPYTQITLTTLRQNALTLHTSPVTDHVSRLTLYGDPQGLATLYAALRPRVPALQQAQKAVRTRTLPFIYQRNFASEVIAALVIMGLGAFMGFVPLLGWRIGTFSNDLQSWFVIACLSVMGVLLLPVGFLMLREVIRAITFDVDKITVQRLWRARTYATFNLQAYDLKAEPRTVRGLPRTFYTLQLKFDAETLSIPPAFDDSTGVRQAQARLELEDLRAALLHNYPMVTLNRPANTFATPNEWGKGWITRIFHVKPYNLIIQEENYGEIHRSADSLHYSFSRPIVEGLTRFRTIDGNLLFTPDGRYLVLYDMSQLIVFDLQEERAFHRKINNGYLHGVELDGNTLRAKRLPLGKPASYLENLPPVPLEHLADHLTPGTGTIPPGDLPTAGPAPRAASSSSTTPDDCVSALLAQARSLGENLPEQFETLREAFAALAPDAYPFIYTAAKTIQDPTILELLVTVLVDSAYPPAFPDFVTWLDHPNDEIRFFCASALDHIANNQFGIDQMIDRGWVQHDRIRAAIPAIKDWWARGGQNRVPTLAIWHKQAAAPPLPDLHKWFNFVELNPWWVRFGDGVVAPKEQGFTLPRNQGTHIVGGQVWFPHGEPVFGAFVMDSAMGWVSEVYVKEEEKWIEISVRMARAEPNFRF
ncbi:MAG: hypothetical protein H6636_09740 [Anaerolineales bacterium]|nr:hypothetical protein [Anaerolineales bacterium]